MGLETTVISNGQCCKRGKISTYKLELIFENNCVSPTIWDALYTVFETINWIRELEGTAVLKEGTAVRKIKL